jgi:hypothetical protein
MELLLDSSVEIVLAIHSGTGMPSVPALDPKNALAWAAEVRHRSEWDLGKNKTPLLMTGTSRSSLASPKMDVLVTVMVEDSTSPQANVYIQYFGFRSGAERCVCRVQCFPRTIREAEDGVPIADRTRAGETPPNFEFGTPRTASLPPYVPTEKVLVVAEVVLSLW